MPGAARSRSRAGPRPASSRAIELARRFEDAGVAAIIYTDIDRDGVLKGLNLPATAELARATSIPVIASGGLAGLDDIEALLQPEYAMLEGAIAGRALYDGRLDAKAALALLSRSRLMNNPSRDTRSRGFGERGQEPFGDIRRLSPKLPALGAPAARSPTIPTSTSCPAGRSAA